MRRSSRRMPFTRSSPPVIAAIAMKEPISMWSGPMRCSAACSSGTPSISSTLVPTPRIRAPIAFR